MCTTSAAILKAASSAPPSTIQVKSSLHYACLLSSRSVCLHCLQWEQGLKLSAEVSAHLQHILCPRCLKLPVPGEVFVLLQCFGNTARYMCSCAAGHTAAYCAAHKLEGMVNNRHKICQFPGCTSHATFKHVGEVHATLCGQHREENMVQVQLSFSHLLRCAAVVQAKVVSCKIFAALCNTRYYLLSGSGSVPAMLCRIRQLQCMESKLPHLWSTCLHVQHCGMQQEGVWGCYSPQLLSMPGGAKMHRVFSS